MLLYWVNLARENVTTMLQLLQHANTSFKESGKCVVAMFNNISFTINV